MSEIEGIVFELEELREKLNSLISEKAKLTNSEVIETSKELDTVLNLYNESIQDLIK